MPRIKKLSDLELAELREEEVRLEADLTEAQLREKGSQTKMIDVRG